MTALLAGQVVATLALTGLVWFVPLDAMVEAGRIRAYGVSVETCAQALRAIARPHVATVQIILNCMRL